MNLIPKHPSEHRGLLSTGSQSSLDPKPSTLPVPKDFSALDPALAGQLLSYVALNKSLQLPAPQLLRKEES